MYIQIFTNFIRINIYLFMNRKKYILNNFQSNNFQNHKSKLKYALIIVALCNALVLYYSSI